MDDKELRELHAATRRVDGEFCWACVTASPCPIVLVLDDRAALRQRVKGLTAFVELFIDDELMTEREFKAKHGRLMDSSEEWLKAARAALMADTAAADGSEVENPVVQWSAIDSDGTADAG